MTGVVTRHGCYISAARANIVITKLMTINMFIREGFLTEKNVKFETLDMIG